MQECASCHVYLMWMICLQWWMVPGLICPRCGSPGWGRAGPKCVVLEPHCQVSGSTDLAEQGLVQGALQCAGQAPALMPAGKIMMLPFLLQEVHIPV